MLKENKQRRLVEAENAPSGSSTSFNVTNAFHGTDPSSEATRGKGSQSNSKQRMSQDSEDDAAALTQYWLDTIRWGRGRGVLH